VVRKRVNCARRGSRRVCPDYPTLAARMPLTEAAALTAHTWSPVVAVQRDHEIVDVVTRRDIFRALARHPEGTADLLVHVSGARLSADVPRSR
jgi:hypothetical protein